MSQTLLRNSLTIAIFLAISWAVLSIEEYDYDENNPELAGYIEGDIVPDSLTRNGYPDRKWPNNTIKYVFSWSFTEAQKETVRKCCRELENRTCVQCRETIFLDYGYVYLTNEQGGCFSQVGFQPYPFAQIMNLGPNCLKNHVIVCHEFMHALGLSHSHNSYDRDDHVRINFENIKEGKEYNFEKKEDSLDCLVPYDRESAMGYGPYVGSKNGNETITPLDGNYTGMGQRKRIADSDIEKINRIYCYNNCTATTNTTTTTTTTTAATTTITEETTTTEEITTILW